MLNSIELILNSVEILLISKKTLKVCVIETVESVELPSRYMCGISDTFNDFF